MVRGSIGVPSAALLPRLQLPNCRVRSDHAPERDLPSCPRGGYRLSTEPRRTEPRPILPGWAEELVSLYESNSYNQFILHGNVQDRLLLPMAGRMRLGSLEEFILEALLPAYDVAFTYDLGNGVRVERGGDILAQ